MDAEAIAVTTVVSDGVVLAYTEKGEDVGEPMWVMPNILWVVAKLGLVGGEGCASNPMEFEGSLCPVNTGNPSSIADEVDGGATVEKETVVSINGGAECLETDSDTIYI